MRMRKGLGQFKKTLHTHLQTIDFLDTSFEQDASTTLQICL